MFKRIILMLFLVMTMCMIKAHKYSGRIFDKLTGEPLPFAYIYDHKGNFLSLSDEKGWFVIDIPAMDSIRINASSVGYMRYQMAFANNSKQLLLALSPISHELDVVEIKAVRNPISINHPYSQSNVYATKIEENISSSLIDALETVPGVYKKSEYHSPIILRGLGGKRILFMQDGNRVMGSTSTGFTGQTVNVFNIEKIEVIKGPASVRYGPGALGGIINLVSKPPFIQAGYSGRILGSYGTNNNEYILLGNMSFCNEHNSFNVGFRYQNASDMSYGNGIKAENSFHKDYDMNALYIYKYSNNLSLSACGNIHIGGPWGRAKGYNGSDYVFQTAEQDNSYQFNLGLNWEVEKIPLLLNASIYYNKDQLKEIRNDYDIGSGKLSFRETIKYDNYYCGWKIHALIQPKSNCQLTIGSDGVYYRVKSPTILQDYFKNYIIHNKVSDNTGIAMGGLFAETQIDLFGEKLKWQIGIRGDLAQMNEGNIHDTLLIKGRNIDFKILNMTTGAMYQFKDDVSITFNIARASRMPDAKELFMESASTDGSVFGNIDLKPEHGMSVDLAMKGCYSSFMFDISFFANFLKDFITQTAWYGSNKKGNNFRYENIDRSLIYGTELSLAYNHNSIFSSSDEINYNGFVVYTKGYEMKKEQKWFTKDNTPLNQITPINMRHELIYRYRFGKKLSAYIGINLLWFAARKEYAVTSYPTGSYCLLGTLMGIQKGYNSLRYKLSLNINNLTNEKYKPFESLIYGMGRNFKILFSIEYGKGGRKLKNYCINE